MNCEHCQATLKNVSSLNYHMKNNKNCLDIQKKSENNIEELFSKCNYCDKTFTNQSLKKHLQTCKHKKRKEDEENKIKLFEDENRNYENILLKQENEILKSEILFLRDTMIKLEAENKIYLQDRELVQKLAAQPKITNNNDTRIRINNNFFDNPEKMKQMIDEKLTKDYISDGQKGVAQFACKNILKDENGNMNYICSDLSRHVFKFYNNEGNIEKDVKANKLTDMLIEAGIANKALSMAPLLWTDEDGNINSNKFLIFSPYTTEIASMQVDNSVFRNELACLTSL